MKCVTRSRCGLNLSVLIAILLAGGCDHSASTPSVADTAAKPAPEQSFDVIMETFKRRVQDTPSGFVIEKGGERSRLMASNVVTSEVFPPKAEGDPYRAEITIVSETRYSLQQSLDESDDSKQDDAKGDQSSASGSADRSAGGKGVEILDPGLINSPGADSQGRRPPSTANDTVIARRDDKEVRVFKLEYKDGRWTLLTSPDPETERAISLAFQEALSTQI